MNPPFPLKILAVLLAVGLLFSACLPEGASPGVSGGMPADDPVHPAQAAAPTPVPPTPIPYPTRPAYAPGELVDYIAQDGDTLPDLAKRFNTKVEEILAANPFIPTSATTMPPGMPMKIPIYYLPFWGNPTQIIPDSLFVDGPAQVGFKTSEFLAGQPGWLNGYLEYASDANRSAADIIDLVALKFSISPRLLLALLEYQSGALTQADPGPSGKLYPLGYRSGDRQGLYSQLLWGANALNNAYYSLRAGLVYSLELDSGRIERFDPWQNTATNALHLFFNQLYSDDDYARAVSAEGFAQTYRNLFGDPSAAAPHIPGSLEQPAFALPFKPGNVWAYTGGPHTAWGNGEPLAAIDFAPPSVAGGCNLTDLWATAVAPGVVVRSEYGEVMLDLDGDGDERTGWDVFYLHIATDGRAPLGAHLNTGDPIGHPSCEGGTSTGTHVHIARKYNGEWILAQGWMAQGILAFNMEGWVVHNGREAYQGTLVRMNRIVTACQCSNAASFIQSDHP